MRIILLGPPAAGKGTQAEFICSRFRIPHIASGDMIREAVKAGTAFGQKAKSEHVDAGQLMDDQSIIALVHERLKQPDCQKGFLLDGFPRTIPQAESLIEAHISIDYVIDLQLEDDIIVKRISGRRVHPASGRVYHIVIHPSKVPGKDDVSGEPLIHRDDDKEETVRERIAIYHKRTEPLIKFYQTLEQKQPDQAPHFVVIDGSGTIESIQSKIMAALK